MTGYEIDVYRETDELTLEDVELDEFSDEIEECVLESLKNIGCDTARSVLDLSKQELVRRTDLEEETIDEVIKILEAELKED